MATNREPEFDPSGETSVLTFSYFLMIMELQFSRLDLCCLCLSSSSSFFIMASKFNAFPKNVFGPDQILLVDAFLGSAPYIYKAVLEDMACAQELNTAIQITFYIKGSSDSKIVLAKEDCG